MINKNFEQLKESYLFSTISQKVNAFAAANPDKEVLRMGIGDVTLPLAPVVIDAMAKAVAEMGNAATFKGYGDEQGYMFLREAVSGYYDGKGVSIANDEIFIGDGAKSDIGNILDIFCNSSKVLMPNPVYPAYADANIMAGRAIDYMDGNRENGFLPMPNPDQKADIIYLCSPNNPTGAVYSKEELTAWVDYAIDNNAVILFDAAYEIFVKSEGLPTSIFQIPNAKKCAIEFGTLSKTAGFTGTRCSYTIVPHELICSGAPLNKLWLRRQTTKFNGLPYIVQKGAAAVFTPHGLAQMGVNIGYYLDNATLISQTLTKMGYWHTGGKNAPYIWLECPNGMSSWEFFDYLLDKANIVGTPGAGFGANGEGYFRLSAFGSKENTKKAMERLAAL